MAKEVTFFDDTSESYLTEYDLKTTDGYSFRVRKTKVLNWIPLAKPNERVLDIGCGPAILSAGLHSKGYDVVGVDAAKNMIRLSNERFSNTKGMHFEIGDVTNLRFKDEEYDIVTALGLIEYIPDETKAISEIARVTKKGGFIIITYPNKISPWRIFNRLFLMFFRWFVALYKKILRLEHHPLTHKEYTLSKTLEDLQKHNLSYVGASYYNFKLIPHPLDRWFPKLTLSQSKFCEKLDSTFLQWIGTGFIVVLRKKP